MPTTIAEAEGPDGVIYASYEYASKFKLRSRLVDNSYHILGNGDKVTGTLPNGMVVKGSIQIRSQANDLEVPPDAIKLRGVSLSSFNQFVVRERAADRITSKRMRLSYQAGQFIPIVTHKRVRMLLDAPLNKLRSVMAAILTPEFREAANNAANSPEVRGEYVLALMPDVTMSTRDLLQALSNSIWDIPVRSICTALFQ